MRRYLPKNVQELIRWYERYISPISLVAGFLADNYILLRRVDLLQSNLLLFSYLAIAAAGIALINLIETGRLRRPWMLKIAPFLPVVVQFSFGGLFSGYLSLYSRSAAFPAGWVFVIVIAALLLGNERFMRFYVRPTFQVALYFTVLFSFFIFFLPVVFRQIGPMMFLFAGATSLLAITLFLTGLGRLVPEILRRDRTSMARAIAVIFVSFNILYFAGAIPPLPLALKDAGVYHSIERQSDGSYVLTGEPLPWYKAFIPYNTTFHRGPDDTVYVWSSIFAPSGLSTLIVHEWQHYDEAGGEWRTVSAPSFRIMGGRENGYRGYSFVNNAQSGRWRVNVRTQYVQLIGRITFTVADSAVEPQLAETVR